VADSLENTVTLDLSGDKFLASFLEDLPQKVYDRVVKTAFRVPAMRIMKTARQLAPITIGNKQKNRPPAGTLRKLIKVRNLRKQKGVVGVRVGTSSRDIPEGEAFYSYFQEYGYKIGKRPFRNRVPERLRAEKLAEKQRLLEHSTETSVFDPGISAARRAKLMAAATERMRKKKTKLASQIADLQVSISGDVRRKIPGKFFIRRAFDAHKNISKQEMRNELIFAVEAEQEKAARKQQQQAKAA
jgi:hypothetical protein